MAVFSDDSNYQGDYRLIRFGCFVNESPDPEVIAIVKNEPYVHHFRNIKKAWQANRKNNKIIEILPKSISCENIYTSPGEIP
ncbi:MAG: hypothetical protein QNJ38_07215 [Prochloraceae cyanobacterium]|nr:hypothetical protein [Prochloraceae cyanobacterium]